MILKLFTDGGARGNPGPGASSALIFSETDKLLNFTAKYFVVTTNNNAEYQALLIGIKAAAKTVSSEFAGDPSIQLDCYLDSELAVKQMNGIYKISDANIKSIKAQIDLVTKTFKKVTYTHIRREQNKLADKLVNLILDTKLSNDL